MVDDHPIIIEGYKNTLLDKYGKIDEFIIDVAYNCDEANDFLQKNKETQPYDLTLIDVNLPASKDGKITSGEDVASIVKELHPEAKIIILTMHSEDNRIHNIFQNINPQGFLIKSDLSSKELLRAVEDVLDGKSYFSDTVNNHFRKMVSNNFTLDQKNLQILYHLSRGIQTNNLGNYIGLSLSAIEKRKNHIKELFDIKSANDEMLIEEARNRGFV